MGATLTRTRTVMTLMHASGPWTAAGVPVENQPAPIATFERWTDDGNRRTLSMEYDAWEDMGRPDTITLTVEPGDRLN